VVDRKGKPRGLNSEGVDPAHLVFVEEPALEPPEETPMLSQEEKELALSLGLKKTQLH